MEVKSIEITPNDHPSIKAFVRIVFEEGLVLDKVKVIHGSKGFFVAYPNYKVQEEWKPYVSWGSKEQAIQFGEKVLEKFHGIKVEPTPAAETASNWGDYS